MLDQLIRPMIDPALVSLSKTMIKARFTADQVTLAGLIIGLAAAGFVANGHMLSGLGLLVLNRFMDGLDGAMARQASVTDRGGYLDIVCDFCIYGAMPLAFAILDPVANGLAAAVLLFSFYVNGASFLAFAAIAARRKIIAQQHESKSIYYTTGLIEGTETILCFGLMLLFPAWFSVIAFIFAALTLITAAGRCILAWTTFGKAS
jgi:phosphatidylglycerophosphate synthase